MEEWAGGWSEAAGGDQCRASRDGGHNESGGRLPSVSAVRGGGAALHRTPHRRPRPSGVGDAADTKGRLMCGTRGIVRPEDPHWG